MSEPRCPRCGHPGVHHGGDGGPCADCDRCWSDEQRHETVHPTTSRPEVPRDARHDHCRSARPSSPSLHVGILSVDDPGRAPLTIPVWYAYVPGGTVNVITGGQSVKAQRLRAAGRFSLAAQAETPPYRYVSVEGPITAIDDTVDPEERRALATRYLGAEGGELYLTATA